MARCFNANSCIRRGPQFAEKFEAHLKQWANSMVCNRKQIRLRVEFGFLSIGNSPGEFLTTTEFVDVFNRAVDHEVDFIPGLDGLRTASSLLHAMHSKHGDFYALDEEHGRHLLILRFSETQMEIEVDCAGRLADGALRIRVAGGAKTVRFPNVCGTTIVTSCPDRAIDWQLDASLVVPTTILTPGYMADLPKNITYAGEEATDGGLIIPRFIISEPNTIGMKAGLGNIEQTVLRTARRYAYKATPYVVEVIEFHTWNGSHTREDPQSSCLVHLYADNWDELMEPMVDVHGTRPWALDVGQLLPGSQQSTTEIKLVDFLRVVDDVQSLLT